MMLSFESLLRRGLDKLSNLFGSTDKDFEEGIKDIRRALILGDVPLDVVKEIENEIRKSRKNYDKKEPFSKYITRKTIEILENYFGGKPEIPFPKTIMLVGLYGQGKTTTAGKLAYFYKKKGKKVILCSLDEKRPAGKEQLRQLAEKAGVDFIEMPRNPEKNEIIIYDTAGRKSLNEEMRKELEEIYKKLKPEKVLLVVASETGQSAKNQIEGFANIFPLDGIILTRFESSSKGGAVLALTKKYKIPVLFVGTGEKIEDLEQFSSKKYISKLLGIPNIDDFLKEVSVDEMLELSEGDFNLLMLKKQIEFTQKKGFFSKIPSMLGININKEMQLLGEKKLKDYYVVMQSMTKEELKNPEIINESRIRRIAKGSGKDETVVRSLLKEYKKMKKLYGKIKRMQGRGIKELMKGLPWSGFR